MNNIKCLSSFDIKIIAFVTMIIDHIAVFFYYFFNEEMYDILRAIGRISMSLFVFLIYQGFKHTSSINKYKRRLLILAVLTQILQIIIGIIINSIYPDYSVYFYEKINIIFSLYILLNIFSILDIIKNKNSKDRERLFGGVLIIIISLLYCFLNIEYGLVVPIIGICIYCIDKLKNNYKKVIITFLGIVSYMAIYIHQPLGFFAFISIIFMILYNGKKGPNLGRIFYVLYPIHINILYIIGAILSK